MITVPWNWFFYASKRRKLASCKLILLLICFVVSSPALSDAVPCDALGFDPAVEGEGILERYFVETDGIGGLGCWMHPHPNGKDAVFTPFSWGQRPNPGKQGLIDETITGISETTDYYRALGTMNTELYILLTDLLREDWTGEAHVIESHRCWMEITAEAGWGASGAGYRREFKSTVAHEIAHCFFNENFEEYNARGMAFDRWWDESGSDFLMGQVYPSVNSEHYSSTEFDMDGQEFMQEYNAVTLLQHYSNTHDVTTTVNFLRSAWEHGRERATYVAYLDGSGLDGFFHDFNAHHYAGAVLDPGGGNMPRESQVESVLTQRLEPEFGTIEIERIEPRRLVLAELVLPKGHAAVIDPPAGLGTDFHASVHVFGQNRDDWEGGMEIRSQCDFDSNLRLLMTTLRAEGVNSQQFHYRTTRISDCDCQGHDPLDACLVGNWEMAPESRGAIFGEDGPVGGRVGVTFYPSGAFIYQFTNLTFHGVSLTNSGRLKMEILKKYQGNVSGCATVAPQGRRLDGAIPMRTEVLADGVTRSLKITHGGGVGTTTDKTETGLEAWFWPHKSTYYRCEGDRLHLESRIFDRAANE